MDEENADSGPAGYSIGFITALVSQELSSCENVLGEMGWTKQVGSPLLRVGGIQKWTKRVHDVNIIAYSAAIGRMGQVSSAVETFTFLTRCKPVELFLTGICGSLDANKVHKADVVVGTAVRWRTQNKVFGEGPRDTYRPYNHSIPNHDRDLVVEVQKFVDRRYPARQRNESDTGSWNVLPGEVFTWDYVVDSARVTGAIKASFPEALCVEMEAGGFLSAIERFAKVSGDRPMRGFVVKGVSDYAARKDKQPGIRTQASQNAARVAVELAEHLIGLRAELSNR